MVAVVSSLLTGAGRAGPDVEHVSFARAWGQTWQTLMAVCAGGFVAGMLLAPLWRRGIFAQVLAGLLSPGLTFLLALSPGLITGPFADPLGAGQFILQAPVLVGLAVFWQPPLAAAWFSGFVLASVWGAYFSLRRAEEEADRQQEPVCPVTDQSRK